MFFVSVQKKLNLNSFFPGFSCKFYFKNIIFLLENKTQKNYWIDNKRVGY